MFARRLGPVCCALVATIAACSSRHPSAGARPPVTEFVVSTPDSAFWISTETGQTTVRGAPIVLARYGGRFYELYSADDDFSYDDAQLVGERIYRRDLVSGDSAVVFVDTIVPRIADAYARSHPNERRLGPHDEGEDRPSTAATAEVDILDVAGPYLSYEYHVDVSLPHRHLWHSTRRGVIDLRSGGEARLTDIFGSVQGDSLAAAGRRAYENTRDSIARDRDSLHDENRRAAQALALLDFDDRSFSLTNDEGAVQVVFGVPGHGEGALGNLVELNPVTVDSVGWWAAFASGAAKSDDAGDDHWTAATYRVLARYDTSGTIARISIADSSRREWPLATILGPIRRIEWLDRPPLAPADRKALARAFDQAAGYDENSRVAAARGPSSRLLPVRFSPHNP